ncbi:uncharacterized protein NEMAJ01_1758 [Nematocida major]|uniref:uncharacterized protein n=1 Tax=Nematocida major TaxID=1912982 RepID=UPI002008B1F8|nr:uncharacterized protein NEMAJ01_1758 [Nematocida major]KAH9386862.1 hypothetical protein NEMAJ01_1758 [Nematocida major]
MDGKLPQTALDKISDELQNLMQEYNKAVCSLKGLYDESQGLRRTFLSAGIEYTKMSESEENIGKAYADYKEMLDKRVTISKRLLADINSTLSSVDQQLLLLESPYEPKFGIQTQNPRVFKTNKSNPAKSAEESEKRYCICNGPAYGDMVACDAFHMEVPWYHMGCVGLTGTPRGHWLCPKCKPSEQ